MDKLNICLVSLMIPPDSQDGESKFFGGIYNYLKNQGHRVTLLTSKWNYELNDPNIIQHDVIKKRFLWAPQFNIKIVNFLRNNEFDIIHGNGIKGSFPIFLSRKKRYISTIHDMGPFEARTTLLPFAQIFIKIIVKGATYITTCSDAIRRQIKHFIPQVDLNHIFNLYSAIEEKYKPFPAESKKLKEQMGIQGPVLIYIGRVGFYKGVDDIIKAYYLAKKEIPTLNLVIGGKPDYKMENTFEEWKRNYRDVHFIGFIPPNKIPMYYSMGDVFVTYSFGSEGFGLTPVEAIACGTPVICSSLPAYKEVLQDNAIFVPPRSPKQLAKEIVLLLKDDSKRAELIKKAQKFITKYSWDSVGGKLEKIYKQFVSL